MADCIAIDNIVQLHAGECRGGFDFTLLFEESILILLPIALAVLLAAFRLTTLLRSPITTASLWLSVTKIVSLFDPFIGSSIR
jgi:ATP-binding cassette subfamily C (CFTR/MRP) protein 1